MPGGRPVEFTEEITQQAWDYVNDGWRKAKHQIPCVVGLCDVINRAKSTIYDWADRDDTEFSDILSVIKEKQKLTLYNGGLSGDMNSAITKLVLGKHGLHDKQVVDSTVKLTDCTEAELNRKLDLLRNEQSAED